MEPFTQNIVLCGDVVLSINNSFSIGILSINNIIPKSVLCINNALS